MCSPSLHLWKAETDSKNVFIAARNAWTSCRDIGDLTSNVNTSSSNRGSTSGEYLYSNMFENRGSTSSEYLYRNMFEGRCLQFVLHVWTSLLFG